MIGSNLPLKAFSNRKDSLRGFNPPPPFLFWSSSEAMEALHCLGKPLSGKDKNRERREMR